MEPNLLRTYAHTTPTRGIGYREGRKSIVVRPYQPHAPLARPAISMRFSGCLSRLPLERIRLLSLRPLTFCNVMLVGAETAGAPSRSASSSLSVDILVVSLPFDRPTLLTSMQRGIQLDEIKRYLSSRQRIFIHAASFGVVRSLLRIL